MSSAVWFYCRACGHEWSTHPAEAIDVRHCVKCGAGREHLGPPFRDRDEPTRPDLPSTIPPPAPGAIDLRLFKPGVALRDPQACSRCDGWLGDHFIRYMGDPVCRPCATAPTPPLDLGALMRDLMAWRVQRADRAYSEEISASSSVVTPADVLRFLRARGLTGVDVRLEGNELLIVPAVSFNCTLTKVPE